jgi:4'-phosphopantetheinyl transferase
MPRIPPPGCADLWWLDIRAVRLGPADLAELDPAERAKAASFAFAADRHRYLVAHVLLRRVLSAYTSIPPGDLLLRREPCPQCGGPNGRPVLAGSALAGSAQAAGDSPEFSLAHSGDAVLITVAGQPAGIDVEQDPHGCMCSMTSAMHAADAAAVAALPEPERHEAIIGWWVLAEAVLKCTGEGIAHGLDGFPVISGSAGTPVHGCSATSVASPPGYRAALALAGDAGITGLTVRAEWDDRGWPEQAPGRPGGCG